MYVLSMYLDIACLLDPSASFNAAIAVQIIYKRKRKIESLNPSGSQKNVEGAAYFGVRRVNPCWMRLRRLEELVVVVRGRDGGGVNGVAVEGVLGDGEGVWESGEGRRVVRIVGCRERRIHGLREREKQRKVMSFLIFWDFN